MTRIRPPLAFSLLALALTSASLAADAAHNWTQHCIRCHGEDGKGATKIGRKLKIKDLTLEKTQRRLSDDEIADLLANGYKDNSGEDRMPAFSQKLTDEERKALIALVRSFKAGPP